LDPEKTSKKGLIRKGHLLGCSSCAQELRYYSVGHCQ